MEPVMDVYGRYRMYIVHSDDRNLFPLGMIGISSSPVATSTSVSTPTPTPVATSASVSTPVATQFQFPLPLGMIGVSSAPVATSVSTPTPVATSVSISTPVATQFQFPLPLGMIGVSSAPVATSVSVSIATPVATSISISTPTPVGVLDRSLLCRTTVSPTPVSSSDTFTSSSSFISNAEVPIRGVNSISRESDKLEGTLNSIARELDKLEGSLNSISRKMDKLEGSLKSIAIVSNIEKGKGQSTKKEEDYSSEVDKKGKSQPLNVDHDDGDENWEFIEKGETKIAA